MIFSNLNDSKTKRNYQNITKSIKFDLSLIYIYTYMYMYV